ncbi:MAG: enediyne biosynthesis protein, partial [Acidobacteriaceae bacterium]|nr:enediyne biosynthesis protein [Acidobacteriaceae bacterium]
MSSADPRHTRGRLCGQVLLLLVWLSTPSMLFAQPAHAVQENSKAAAPPSTAATQLLDITTRTGIHFDHMSTPDARYIVESMSGGLALIDYDRDGYPDIYFTNAASVEMG